ncbi:hypothetical protein HDU97_000315 [Phlyctochytrium planicorne]|nr:hypothetical protein HDU97_000315 [Phlyctochytrium planicorne]
MVEEVRKRRQEALGQIFTRKRRREELSRMLKEVPGNRGIGLEEGVFQTILPEDMDPVTGFSLNEEQFQLRSDGGGQAAPQQEEDNDDDDGGGQAAPMQEDDDDDDDQG